MLSFASGPAFASTPTADGIAVVAAVDGRSAQTIALGRLAQIAQKQGHAVELVQGKKGPMLFVSRRGMGDERRAA